MLPNIFLEGLETTSNFTGLILGGILVSPKIKLDNMLQFLHSFLVKNTRLLAHSGLELHAYDMFKKKKKKGKNMRFENKLQLHGLRTKLFDTNREILSIDLHYAINSEVDNRHCYQMTLHEKKATI